MTEIRLCDRNLKGEKAIFSAKSTGWRTFSRKNSLKQDFFLFHSVTLPRHVVIIVSERSSRHDPNPIQFFEITKRETRQPQ